MIRLYTFLIFVAIIVTLGHIFFVLPKQEYISQTQFLVVLENAKTSSNADNVINDIVLIANKVIENNKDVIRYDAHAEFERVENHSMITLTNLSHGQKEVPVLEKSIIKSSLKSVERYYAYDVDFSLKIIEKDPSAYRTPLSVYSVYVLMAAIAVGIISGILALFHLFDGVRHEKTYEQAINGRKIFEKYNVDIKSDDNLDAKEDLIHTKEKEEAPVILSLESDMQKVKKKESKNDLTKKEVKKKKGVKKEASESEKKSKEQIIKQGEGITPGSIPTTPGNLPIVDLDSIGFSQEDNDQKNGDDKNNELNKEPTEEELKARLNALLNGKL